MTIIAVITDGPLQITPRYINCIIFELKDWNNDPSDYLIKVVFLFDWFIKA